MKIEVEFRSSMSRAELFRALRIAAEAGERLAHRMTDAELGRLADAGAALTGVANGEYARRRHRVETRNAGARFSGRTIQGRAS